MSASKHINIICVIITILAVVGTILFMNGQKLGIVADDSVELEYVDTLFDDSYVHTINIEIDNWDELIENAESEEYTNANVTIDGETVKNVGIRAKGNTSLSTVSQLGSERYSFKIEFDSYEDTGNYKGLDKLCLNNLIQDYTMMKDYIAYKLMNEFGADAPLASFCYITVNGEDWGLYLAVEAVEDSFLQRNYGKNYGELCKPDSMSMGGGRGNGRDFDMEDFDFEAFGEKNPFESSGDDESNADSEQKTEQDQKSEKESIDDSRPKMPGGDFSGGFTGGDFPSGDFSGGEILSGDFSGGNFPGGGDFPSGDFGGNGGFPGGGDFPGGGGPFGMGNSDVKLQFSDDDVDSYSTIFNNAKTVVKTSDKKRLIKSLKNLSEGIENSDSDLIEQAVNTDEVMRYMVVHNFVVNGDSYTGSMIHNYYLYEEDGQMSMIPWDYNLAYGTFQGQDATGQVNDPIDTPLSITEDSTDRPMFSWITSSDEYTEQYHKYYEEFLEQFYTSGYLQNLIDDTYEMLYEYVEKDPTKFCTIEEYEQAVKTLKGFIELRCQSIEGQVNGEIPTTDSLQQANSDSLIDASSLTLSDMGSMGGGFGGPGGHGGDSNNSGGPGGPGSDFKFPGDSDTQKGSDFLGDNETGKPSFNDSDKKNGMGEKHRENK